MVHRTLRKAPSNVSVKIIEASVPTRIDTPNNDLEVTGFQFRCSSEAINRLTIPDIYSA